MTRKRFLAQGFADAKALGGRESEPLVEVGFVGRLEGVKHTNDPFHAVQSVPSAHWHRCEDRA
jgi:hypothetical protein